MDTFEQRRTNRLQRTQNTIQLLVKLPPLLAITDVGGYDWTPFGEDDPYDERDEFALAQADPIEGYYGC